MVVTALDQKRNACIDALNDLMHSCSEMAQECRDVMYTVPTAENGTLTCPAQSPNGTGLVTN